MPSGNLGKKEMEEASHLRYLNTNTTYMALLLMFHWSKLFMGLQPDCKAG